MGFKAGCGYKVWTASFLGHHFPSLLLPQAALDPLHRSPELESSLQLHLHVSGKALGLPQGTYTLLEIIKGTLSALQR